MSTANKLSKEQILALDDEGIKAIIADKSYRTAELEFLKHSDVSKDVKSCFYMRRILSPFIDAHVTPDDVYRKMFGADED